MVYTSTDVYILIYRCIRTYIDVYVLIFLLARRRRRRPSWCVCVCVCVCVYWRLFLLRREELSSRYDILR
jgi:hypothetical protein